MTCPEATSDSGAPLDERLAWARSDLATWERLRGQLESGRRHLAVLAARRSRLRERTARERADVDALEGLSLSLLLEHIFGDADARRDREVSEWLAARLETEEVEREILATRAEVEAQQRRLDAMADPRETYHRLLAEKSRWLTSVEVDAGERRLHLAEREGVLVDCLREIEEASWAGEVARAALAGLLHALSRAQALGRLDMIGLASTWVKFEHVDDAHRHASAANRALSRFQRELQDVQERHDAHLTLEISSLATFADDFFDDLVSDWVVQCRIDRSHRSAGIARTRVNRTLRSLATRRQRIVAELERVRERKRRLGLGIPGIR